MKSLSIQIIISSQFLVSLLSCYNSSNPQSENDKTIDSISETVELDDSLSVLSKAQYIDLNGFFKVTPPAEWEIENYPSDPRGKVAFHGPDKVDLRILAKGLDYSSFEEMRNDLIGIEKSINTNTNIKEFEFYSIQAIERTFTYNGLKLFVIDFIVGSASHNIMYSASPKTFEKYLSVAKKSIETYEPILKELSEEEIRNHMISKYIRLSQIYYENGNIELCKQYINEGLKIEPNNAYLLDLRVKITGK